MKMIDFDAASFGLIILNDMNAITTRKRFLTSTDDLSPESYQSLETQIN